MDACFFCGVPADQVCPHCGLVSFCSAECLSFHRSPKGRCFPFRVAFSAEKGQHLVATRNIKVGARFLNINRVKGVLALAYQAAVSNFTKPRVSHTRSYSTGFS